MSNFQSVPISQIVESNPTVVTIKQNETVGQALQVLRENNFTSLGVTDKEGDCFVGLLTAYDLMAWICLGVYKEGSTTASESLDKPAGDVTGVFHDETNHIWCFEDKAPLSECLEALSKGVHRAVVVMEDGTFKIISQFDVVRFAAKQSWEKSSKPLDEVMSMTRSVCAVRSDETALSALRQMERENFTSLPIVDKDTGAVISTVSAEDVRNLTVDSLNQVENNVLDFVTAIHSGSKPGAMTFTARQSIGDVMNQMVDSQQRHAWIVNADNQPISSVSYSDLIAQMLP